MSSSSNKLVYIKPYYLYSQGSMNGTIEEKAINFSRKARGEQGFCSGKMLWEACTVKGIAYMKI